MQLVEQGKLNLETDIREYLPEGFLKKLKYESPISLLNLMNHNAGWLIL
nr:serine hydrolase [Paenibacillus sp. FSL P4-0081]